MAEDLTAFPKFALDKVHRVGVNNEPETIPNYNIRMCYTPTGKVHTSNRSNALQQINMLLQCMMILYDNQ